MSNPNELLANLVKALDSAFISSWQRELDAAREYVKRLEETK